MPIALRNDTQASSLGWPRCEHGKSNALRILVRSLWCHTLIAACMAPMLTLRCFKLVFSPIDSGDSPLDDQPWLQKIHVSHVTSLLIAASKWNFLTVDLSDSFNYEQISKDVRSILIRTAYSNLSFPPADGINFFCKVFLAVIRRDISGNTARWLARRPDLFPAGFAEALAIRFVFVDAVDSLPLLHVLLVLLLSNRGITTEVNGTGLRSLLINQYMKSIPGPFDHARILLNAIRLALNPLQDFGDEVKFLTVAGEARISSFLAPKHWAHLRKRWSQFVWFESRSHEHMDEPPALYAPLEIGLVHYIFSDEHAEVAVAGDVPFTGFGVDPLGKYTIENGLIKVGYGCPVEYVRVYENGLRVPMQLFMHEFGISGLCNIEKMPIEAEKKEFDGWTCTYMSTIPYSEENWNALCEQKIKPRPKISEISDDEDNALIQRYKNIQARLVNDPTIRDQRLDSLLFCRVAFSMSLSLFSITNLGNLNELNTDFAAAVLQGKNKIFDGPEETLAKYNRRCNEQIRAVVQLIFQRLILARNFMETIDADIEALQSRTESDAEVEARIRWFYILNLSYFEYYGQNPFSVGLANFLIHAKNVNEITGNMLVSVVRPRYDNAHDHMWETKDKKLKDVKRKAGLLGYDTTKDDDDEEEENLSNKGFGLGKTILAISVVSAVLLAASVTAGYFWQRRRKDR